jgi:D-aminopeptidase
LKEKLDDDFADGSIMIIIATDAPLSDRNLKRLAERGLAGLARTGASMSNGSGDYAIAFSTAEAVRRTEERRVQVWAYPEVPNANMSPLFQAVIEAVEEAIYNSLCMAETMTGRQGRTIHALPLDGIST